MVLIPGIAFADEPLSVRYLERDGRIEVSGSGAATAQTPFTLASIGKTMTSVAILQLVANNTLSLDDLAQLWLDEDTVSGFAGLDGVTIRHLLTMTSGLPDYLTDDYIDDALADPKTIQNPQTAVSYAYDEDNLFVPGHGFDYSNTNYVLLGIILENASGLSYADAMRYYIFAPAKMVNSFVFGSTNLPVQFPYGHENGRHVRNYYQASGFGDGGVISTASDVANFYKSLFIDQNLLSTPMMHEFTRDIQRAGYGMGIEMENGVYGHSGGDLGFSTDVRIDIASGDIAIVLIAAENADTDWAFEVLSGH